MLHQYRSAGIITSIVANLLACAGFVPFAGEGYALLLPSKWNPSPEQEFGSGTILRCERGTRCYVVYRHALRSSLRQG